MTPNAEREWASEFHRLFVLSHISQSFYSEIQEVDAWVEAYDKMENFIKSVERAATEKAIRRCVEMVDAQNYWTSDGFFKPIEFKQDVLATLPEVEK